MRTVLVCVRTPVAAQNVAALAARLGLSAAMRTAASEPEVMLRLTERAYDMVLADTGLARPDPAAFVRRVMARAPGAAVLLIGPEERGAAAAAIAAGARGLVQPEAGDLVTAVVKAMLLLATPPRNRSVGALPGAGGPARAGRLAGDRPPAGPRRDVTPAARALPTSGAPTAPARGVVGPATEPGAGGPGAGGPGAGGIEPPAVVPAQRGDETGGEAAGADASGGGGETGGETGAQPRARDARPGSGADPALGNWPPARPGGTGRGSAGPPGVPGPGGRPGPAGAAEPATVGQRVALTEREMQVLIGMADGKSNAEIGRELFVSEDTVKTHARRLFRKLGARDRAHAVAAGFRAGLVA